MIRLILIFTFFILSKSSMLLCFTQTNVRSLKSSNKVISFWVNNKHNRWSISPETSIDRLEIFCPTGKKKIKFVTDSDSLIFFLGTNDTVAFNILLDNRIAYTEVIGFSDLPNKISHEEKFYYLSSFWSEVKYNFVNHDKITFSWDSLYKTFIPRIAETKNDYDFFRTLQQFSASLSDGHTQVSDNGYFSKFKDYIPITLREFNQKVYIVSIRKGSQLDSSFIGAEITTISLIPTIEYLKDSVFPYISASTEHHLWMQGVYSLHSGLVTNSFKATVKKKNGLQENIELKYNGEETRKENDEYWGRSYDFNSPIVDFLILKNNISFLSINSFHPSVKNLIYNSISNINNTNGLIIDLRRNGGGSTEVAWLLQSVLTMNNTFLNFAWQTRVNNGVKKANGNWIAEYSNYYYNNALEYNASDTIQIPDSIIKITVPVVVLIGKYTFSAAEDFLVNIYNTDNRPILIGEETGGSTGSPLVIPLPYSGYGRICTRRICYPGTNIPFINMGIKPDIFIECTLDSFLSHKDEQLEKAIEIILRQ